MKNKLSIYHLLIIVAAIVLTVVLRFDLSFYHFTPIGGLALLGAAYLRPTWKAFAIPLGVWWITDLVLNNVVYAKYFDGFVFASKPFLFAALSLLLIVLLGSVLLSKVTLPRLLAGGLGAAILFFIISNFGVWLLGTDGRDLMSVYVAGIPFFKANILGDLLFTLVLFGAWSLADVRASHGQIA